MVNAPPLVNIMAFLFIGAIMLLGAAALLFPARLARALAKFTCSVYVRQDNGRDVWKYWGFDWQWHPYSREESMRLLKTAMREPEGVPIVIHTVRLIGMVILVMSTSMLLLMVTLALSS